MNLAYSSDECTRLEALERYRIMDTAPEPQFDELTQLVAHICETPMAVITLIDAKRQWFKSRIGIKVSETAREIAFCNIAIQQRDLFIVNDSHRDPRFVDNPLVRGDPYIRFYAGAPLLSAEGVPLGTLAVLDHVPRELNDLQKEALRVLGREVVAQLELRKNISMLSQALNERDRYEERLRGSHRELERRVSERTRALNDANETLKQEVEKRGREVALSQAIIDSLPGVFYLFDKQGKFNRWNKNLETVTGYKHDEVAAAHPLDFLGIDSEKEQVANCIGKVFNKGCASVEASLVTKSGKALPYYFSGVRIELDGEACLCGLGLDITERRRAEESLRLRDRALQASINAIIITDLEGNIEYTNPAFETITGYSAAEVLGKNCRILQGQDTEQPGVVTLRHAVRTCDEASVLLRNYRKDGRLFWNDVHIAPVRNPDGSATHFVGVLNDITEIKHYEAELERQANFDTLTELANRSVLMDRIRQAIATSQRIGGFVAVGFMDLDNFKFINDSLGHTVGDELLKRVAERLLGCLRGQDTVARYGGDEFAFVLLGQHDENSVTALMERVLKTIDKPFDIDGNRLYVSCSIGLSFYPRDGTDVETLLMNADAAMYRAKDRGRNNFQIYTPSMNRLVTERLSLESRLRKALAEDEFALHYQPKVDLRSGRIVGAEALLRWYPAEGEVVPPSTFIPLAEETGLIVPIGEWVLYTACTHNKILQQAHLPPLRIAVNISSRQFEPETLVSTVSRALTAAGLHGSDLELELTESLVMRNPEQAIKVLNELKSMGLSLSIDDFGTGHSSLSYLQRFPVDHLKIDQSFVRDIGADPNDAIIARAVISLGHSLGMSVVAEGVSSAEQLSFLRENGCDEIQGYLFSRPVPVDELRLMLQEGRSLPGA